MTPNERLASVMKANHIPQEDLAAEAGVSQPTIHRMVKGTQNLNWKVLAALRQKYQVDINLFFDSANQSRGDVPGTKTKRKL
ncbi:helix-turn-helix domain-containing protein [Pedobacter sp. SYP-B3415]|uniref:helix-turn-helix domain-containing protein n=1 Tax=Pedobacter sp. SYP-B3415 TaxID=2496641 RepID=UPI00101BFCBC|nr:helix-turn-helix transcriptional regulator [Pedobacter sp. SYP-B3415]